MTVDGKVMAPIKKKNIFFSKSGKKEGNILKMITVI